VSGPAGTPAPAPAPSPAVAQRFADPDMLVRANIFGKEEIVPVSVATADYQTKQASKLALDEAKRIRAESHIDREHAERWRVLEHQLKTNPEQAFAGLERLSGVTRQAQSGFSETPPTPAAPRETSELTDRLTRLERTQNQVELKARVGEALDSFPYYRNNPEARGFAEKQILAHTVINPNTDPLDVARECHSYEMKRASVAETQTRDGRVANQANQPNIPAAVGYPDLSDIPQGKASDLTDGGFKRNFLAAAARFGAQVVGR
jgi:hypothetical protein